MQDNTNTRKRPGSSTAAAIPQQNMAQQNYPFQPLPDDTDFSNFDFSQPLPPADQQAFANPTGTFDANNFNYNLNNAQQPMYGANYAAPANPSTDLVRRSRNQQLAAPQQNAQQDQWNGISGMSAPVKTNADEEDEEDLDMKVALAKKDAQGKRRNILPFVQKLSSFLDSNNTDLIRWSDDGRSFIVLDEDEFARTLIPEVFKHNNYASFVRQLNMYGFHKTVNITDGSLRQSEKARKGVKPPSMYSHPFFRRNRPDLLWLVQKPAGGNKATKRKREGGYDSDEDRQYAVGPEGQQLGAPNSSQDLAQLPRNELNAVRKELQTLQTQQRYISQMITQLKEQNDTFYRQASTFQALHDRHENSINAILTFLATFYRQGLEGHGAQNLVNMFTGLPPQNQQHGSVVEEYNETTPTPTNQVQRFVKRTPLLLPGPTGEASDQTHISAQHLQPGSVGTEPNSARASATPPNESSKRGSTSDGAVDGGAQPQSASTPVVKNEVPTPNNDQMMDMINNANATTQASTPGSNAAPPTAIDMNSIVDRLNQNNSPLTAQQREDMVNSVLGNSSTSNNAALTSYKPATDPAQWKEQLDQSHNALDYLQQLQKQQDAKVQELNRRLQPLSPSGTIPGLHQYDANQDPFDNLGNPGDYDPSAFLFDDPQPWDNADGNGNFDFTFDPDGDAWNDFDNGGDGNDMFASAPVDGASGDAAATTGQVESVAGDEAASPAVATGNGTADLAEQPSNKRTRRS